MKIKHILCSFTLITSLDGAMKEKTAFCLTGLWICAGRCQPGSERPKFRITIKARREKVSVLVGFTISSPQRRYSHGVMFLYVSN